MKQRVGDGRLVPKIRRLCQQRCQRVPWRQGPKRFDQIADPVLRRPDPEQAAILLQHVYARSTVRSVHHQMHGPVGLKCSSQSSKAQLRFRQVMEYSCAYDLIKFSSELRDPLERELIKLE